VIPLSLKAGLAPVVMDGDVDTGVGVFRGETVDGNEGGGSMVVPNVVVPISESTREPIATVSTEEWLPVGEKGLAHGRTKEGEVEGESQGE